MNKFTAMGHLTANAATKTVSLKNGTNAKVTTVTVAVNDGYGEHQHTEYIRVSIWRDRGEKLAQYLTKGRAVMISGAIRCQAWKKKDGTPAYQLELANPQIELIGKNASVATEEAPMAAPEELEAVAAVENEAELPF